MNSRCSREDASRVTASVRMQVVPRRTVSTRPGAAMQAGENFFRVKTAYLRLRVEALQMRESDLNVEFRRRPAWSRS